jgi:hypothetical protein
MTIEPKYNRTEINCTCKMLQNWARNPKMPIKYNDNTKEYALVGRASIRVFIFYCPFCGGRLPESKRPSYQPAADEVKDLRALMRDVTNVGSIRRILGKPDHTYRWTDDGLSRFHDIEKWKRSYVYEKRWRTLLLWVFEHDDSSISYAFAGKAEPRPLKRQSD